MRMAGLDNWAFIAVDTGESAQFYIFLSITVLGFLTSLVIRPFGQRSLPRIPYFILVAVFFLVVSVLPFAWLLTYKAMSMGLFGLLYFGLATAVFIFGFANGIIARARSISAYGTAKCAWLALIPLANLVLFFMPHREASGAPRTMWRTAGNSVVILIGLVLLSVGKPISDEADRALTRMIEIGMNDPDIEQIKIQARLHAQGLETTLKQMATDTVQKIDEVTTLKRVGAGAVKLTYEYEVSNAIDALPEGLNTTVLDETCGSKTLGPIIDAGGIVDFVYRRTDGADLGLVTIGSRDCAF